ncbi:MAG TPA: hypothetical protein PKX91_04460 [Clostridia bacterium]|jgi:beta-mannosidase|nr:hypothetical protein [Clostridia bacterium]
MKKIDLNGIWKLKNLDGEESCDILMPSCNYVGLHKAGIIDDPIIEDNEGKLQWISEKRWEFCRDFKISEEEIAKDNLILVFEQIDTLATIYINGELVGETVSAHIIYEFDIKRFVTVGKNSIRIVFEPPHDKIAKYQEQFKLPKRSLGIHGNPHVRFPQYHFGWDWGPTFISCGLTRDTYILTYDNRISDFIVTQNHLDKRVELKFTLKDEKGDGVYKGTVTTPSNEKLEIKFDGGIGKCAIENPELWWCSGLGDQPLYEITISLYNPQSDEVLDEITKKIGLRTIELYRKEDDFGEDFCFIINGERIFAKGANWIPSDIFVSKTTKEELEKIILDAKKANMNMLRVWGGGYYETETFYDLCDKYGILVWQDLPFACAAYDLLREDFLASTIQELKDNVKRLRHRASLAIWCGNNEMESLSDSWIENRQKLLSEYETFFYEIVPTELAKLDTVTPYWASSPSSGVFLKGVDDDSRGDTHLWAVWHGLLDPTYYNKRRTRFCSEFGMQSMPTLNAIEIFSKNEGADLENKIMLRHQKCEHGNAKMKYYVNKMFYAPKNKDDYVYLTQCVQAETMEIGTLGWRSMKGECNGALYWQLNDCWGVNSWASIDYYGNYKGLQYRARHFFSPIVAYPYLDDKVVKIVCINDTLSDEKIKLTIRVGDKKDKCKIIEEVKEFVIEKGKAVVIKECPLNKLDFGKNTYIMTILEKDGIEIMRRTYLKSNRHLEKEPVKIMDIKKEGEVCQIELNSPCFSRFVELRLPGEINPFSDNFFDMYPGETRTITIKTDKTLEDIQAALSVKTINVIKPRGSRLVDRLEMIKIASHPVVLASFVYHSLK